MRTKVTTAPRSSPGVISQNKDILDRRVQRGEDGGLGGLRSAAGACSLASPAPSIKTNYEIVFSISIVFPLYLIYLNRF